MFYLYVKTHSKTDLKYLGKTNRPDPHLYPGSGKYWKFHLEKHGYDYSTQILLATEDQSDLRETGLFFSKLFGIVKSNDWANLREESGDGLSSSDATEENLRRIKNGSHPFCNPNFNENTKGKRSETIRKNGSHNFLGGEIQRAAYKRRVETGKQLELNSNISKRMKKEAEEGKHNFQNFISVVNPEGTMLTIPKDQYKKDPSLVHINSIEGKQRLSYPLLTEKMKNYLSKRIKCPHCDLEGNVSNMMRWHFENCKQKTF